MEFSIYMIFESNNVYFMVSFDFYLTVVKIRIKPHWEWKNGVCKIDFAYSNENLMTRDFTSLVYLFIACS